MRGVSMELSNGHVSGRIAGQSSQNLIPSRPFIFLALTVQMWYWKKTFMRIYGLWNLRFDPSRCDLCLSIRGQMLGRNDWIVRDVSFASLFVWYFLFLRFLIYIFFIMIFFNAFYLYLFDFINIGRSIHFENKYFNDSFACFYVLLYLNSTSYS